MVRPCLRLFSLLALTLVSMRAYAVPFVLNALTTNGNIQGTIDVDTVAGVATGANLTYTAGSLVRKITSAPTSQGEDSTNVGNHVYFINFVDTGIRLHIAFLAATLQQFTGVNAICTAQYFCLLQARPIVQSDQSTVSLDTGNDTVLNGSLTPGAPGVNGFDSSTVALNGSATLNGNALRLTTTATTNQAGSAFFYTPLSVRLFTTDLASS